MKIRCLIVVAAALALNNCTPDFAKQDLSNVILRIVRITAAAGSGPGAGEDSDFLISDISPNFNDSATVTLIAIPKNPLVADFTFNDSRLNDVLLERYEVRYIRSDGRNTEGVDVPYRISGGLAVLIPATVAGANETEASFVLVRHAAKEEPPLRNLVGVFPALSTLQTGGAGILTVVAEITLHGRTTSGKAVQTTGRITIHFADFADQDSGGGTPG